MSVPMLCDGCNVNWPHEHRCHNIGFVGFITVYGDKVYQRCECERCRIFWDDEYRENNPEFLAFKAELEANQ